MRSYNASSRGCSDGCVAHSAASICACVMRRGACAASTGDIRASLRSFRGLEDACRMCEGDAHGGGAHATPSPSDSFSSESSPDAKPELPPSLVRPPCPPICKERPCESCLSRSNSSCALYATACRSAPVSPSLFSARISKFTSAASVKPRSALFKIEARACRCGRPQSTLRSRRPGRSSAGSIKSGRVEAASTATPDNTSIPSSWQSS
mmetsp:Transcript_24272/g.61491  ORF Transcript_24272/g.61491 Transcript_24272/m.61491 type:complete len:209 (-) Transcript_24272:2304-2930(-)